MMTETLDNGTVVAVGPRLFLADCVLALSQMLARWSWRLHRLVGYLDPCGRGQ